VGLDAAFFLFGLFSNGWYALALESSAEQARSRTNAGIATAGYSMASNIGVAVIPVVVGPLVISAPALWIAIITVMAVVAVLVPFLAKSQSGKAGQLPA
jgi:MFS family permease